LYEGTINELITNVLPNRVDPYTMLPLNVEVNILEIVTIDPFIDENNTIGIMIVDVVIVLPFILDTIVFALSVDADNVENTI
jgi:hypothetical protein